ncbi:transglutaminase-like domain-containing protein [Bacillus spizizenii]|uniref:transglutaminase-like domain-containing protein n=1 Tax=Bacillus spizizenii TaxID=96241 RepID=UPI0002F9C541|nr:transglutaminase-like domain-containing protein [Bacillus spizizenii]
MMKKPFIVDYSYKNSLDQTIELWLPIPDGLGQTTLKPSQLHRLPTGENLGYFILHKDDTLHFQYTREWYTSKGKTIPLSKEEEEYYLRDTILSPVNKEILDLARDITIGINSKRDQAKAIFRYIVTHYKYKYPPKSRGVKSFLRFKNGDCAEFSFLFSSLCRSLGIPTRTLFGSWSFGNMNGHAWNEIYLEDEGWIAVDVSMANLRKHNILRFLYSDLRTMWWGKYFGKTEGQRVVFSSDSEIELMPAFGDSKGKSNAIEPLQINDRAFYWGQESLKGAAPYLQPAYVKIDTQNLLPSTSIGVENLLGTWKVKETGWRGFLAQSKKYLVMIALATMGVNYIYSNNYLEFLFKFSFVALFSCFVLRRERPFLFSIFLVIMTLSLLSTIDELL